MTFKKFFFLFKKSTFREGKKLYPNCPLIVMEATMRAYVKKRKYSIGFKIKVGHYT